MTAKERAIELYNKFRNESPVLEANYKSKKRAIICVNEMLSVIITGSYNEIFYKEVKSEIEKL